MAYVKKINGYVIKDEEARNRLTTVEGDVATNKNSIAALQTKDTEQAAEIAGVKARVSTNEADIATLKAGQAEDKTSIGNLNTEVTNLKTSVTNAGKIDKVKINGAALNIDTTDKSVNIEVDGTYNASTNKIATQSTVEAAVGQAGKIDKVQLGGVDVPVSNKTVNIQTDGTYNASTNKVATQSTVEAAKNSILNQKGQAGGFASLDSEGKVPSAQLPSYVDDVLEFDKKASFPATGEAGKIYVDKATNITYRWGGTAYAEISSSLALGETSSTAYAGDKGKQNAQDIATLKTTVGDHTEAINQNAEGISQNAQDIEELGDAIDGLGLVETYDENAESLGIAVGNGETASFGAVLKNVDVPIYDVNGGLSPLEALVLPADGAETKLCIVKLSTDLGISEDQVVRFTATQEGNELFYNGLVHATFGRSNAGMMCRDITVALTNYGSSQYAVTKLALWYLATK